MNEFMETKVAFERLSYGCSHPLSKEELEQIKKILQEVQWDYCKPEMIDLVIDEYMGNFLLKKRRIQKSDKRYLQILKDAQKSKSFIPFLSGRPKRDEVINACDIGNLKIALAMAKTEDEFLKFI